MLHLLAALAAAATSPSISNIHSNAFGEDVPVATRPLSFTSTPSKAHVRYESVDDEYLARFRDVHDLDKIAAGPGGDLGRLGRLTQWAHKQWAHNGSNEPSIADPLTILAEAKTGKEFRCVEYSIVLAAAANAIGIPARVLNIKMADAETRAGGAGHVVVEAYLPDRRKWVMADGQFGIMPMNGKRPLNAVEFQAAIAGGNRALNLGPNAQTKLAEYLDFVRPYLFYFDVARQPIYDDQGLQHGGNIMLVPLGAQEPKVFQKRFSLGDMTYTHSFAQFYDPPARRTN